MMHTSTPRRPLAPVPPLALAAAMAAALCSPLAHAACGDPYTAIPTVQGSGSSTPLQGSTVTVQGVVIGDYEGASPALRGFFLQDPVGDGNPATSDGIFIFNGANTNRVSVGQLVRVTGTAGENQGQTQVSASSIEVCGTGTVTPTDVQLPFASATEAERWEGMLVRLPQTLTVTEHFQLGRFGQVVLSVGGRQAQPTNVVAPGAPALELQAANALGRLIVDDALNSQNPDPILFGRHGQPLSAANTLRGGDTVTGLLGVLTWTWAGNNASGNAWRVRPVGALGGGVPDFLASNPRPATAPLANGSLRVAGFNVLNYFNTTSGCTAGVGGPATDCRGANSAAELERQAAKTVAALVKLNADVAGLVEIENDGYGAGSALADLVGRLNTATAPGRYAWLDVDARTSQVNALGSDAIKVAFIYQPARVAPVGRTAVLNSVAFVTGGDAEERNRPALAQAWEQPNGARFIAVVNHLKSKGSACTAPDAGDGQGNCNAVRVNAAQALRTWLAGNPTGTSDPDVLILGDLNAYAKEDPVAVFTNAGWRDLIAAYGGAGAYGYAFDGQWGYLDHALATPSLANGQIAGATHWHVNADEPSVLDYNVEFKSAGQVASLYAADEFRNSDHDPVVVDLALAPLNRVQGSAAADVLRGTAGDDILIGGPGRDTLTGGDGRDRFQFDSVLDGVDTITDFEIGRDVFVLTRLLRSVGVVGSQALASGALSCADGAAGAQLSVDSDGSTGVLRPRGLALVQGRSCSALMQPIHFIF